MRVSSATLPSCIGTLKSTRTRAVLPPQPTSRTVQRRPTLARCGGLRPRTLAHSRGFANDLAQDRSIHRGATAQVAGDERGDVREAAGVAVLVVVPAHDLGQVADHKRIQATEDRRTGVAPEVG